MTQCYDHVMTGLPAGESCEDCQKAFESSSHVCPHCWHPVTNSAYFGKRGKSPHLTGKCAEKFEGIPASWFERRTTKARGYDCLTSFIRSSEQAPRYNPKGPWYKEPSEASAIDPQTERLMVILEEQNRLLKQLVA